MTLSILAVGVPGAARPVTDHDGTPGPVAARDRVQRADTSVPVRQQARASTIRRTQEACGQEWWVRERNWRGYIGEWMPAGELDSREYPLIETSRYGPGCKATEEQAAWAREFVKRSYLSAVKHGWFDFENGKRDGFVPYKPNVRNEDHFVNVAFSLDDEVLNPDRPEYLMYYRTDEGMQLVGFMYFVRELGEKGPQPGGPLTVWHYHQFEIPGCLDRMQMFSAVEGPDGYRCERGELSGHESPEMLHVWFVDHPEGAYATSMSLPPGILAGGIRDDLRRLADPGGV
jgi:hypothetical protein